MAAIKGEDFLKWPTKLLSKGNKRDKSKYCRFQGDHGHNTDECRHLKEEIELLINRGYLRKYVKEDDRRREHRERSPRGRSPRRSPARHESRALASPRPKIHQPPPNRVINTIMGGPAAGGTSSSAQKAYAHRVNTIHACNKKTKTENEISFSDAYLDNLILPHDDALVITMLVAN
ncbi:uncharacterized protein LOC143869812 [Tasmannia lanceolata]|uniref:uncharacterized protein LOC143869812 n=1 Tax=Tasmannia lanceolata TaxID=3420 RepID=UPI00406347EB